MKDRKIFIINGVLVTAAVVVVGFFVFRFFFKPGDNLTKFLPKQTIAYFEYEVDNKDLNDFFVENKRGQVRFEKLIAVSGLLGGFDWQTIKDNFKKIGLAVVMVEKNEGIIFKKAWLLETKDELSIEALVPKDYFIKKIDDQSWVVADERDVADFFKKQDGLDSQTPTQRVIFEKFSRHKFLNAYLAKEYVLILKEKETDVAKLFLDQLEMEPMSPAYFSLRADGNQLIFNFQAAAEVGASQQELNAAANSFFNELLSLRSVFLVAVKANWRDMIVRVEEHFTGVLGRQEVDDQKTELANKYGFKWTEFYDLADHPLALIFEHKTERPMTDELLATTDGQQALIFSFKDEDEVNYFYEKIKLVVRRYLAYKYPIVKDVAVAENDFVKQLVADPEAIELLVENGVEFSQQSPQIVLAKSQNKIVVGWNKDFVIQILGDLAKNDRIKSCPTFSGSQAFYIHTADLSEGLMSYVDAINLVVAVAGGGFNIKGCLMW